mgnify:CR=1 FL=1
MMKHFFNIENKTLTLIDKNQTYFILLKIIIKSLENIFLFFKTLFLKSVKLNYL